MDFAKILEKWRKINSRLQRTGYTPHMHLAFYCLFSFLLIVFGVHVVLAFVLPWLVGLVKELTDINFGWDDLLANTVGCVLGSVIIPFFVRML